ncbi:mechanosensitive ion channel family protein [Leptolyngbya sp. AN02str]|uniref:mechanosensitive ion channel family protein n=1 Tax=Leptolyngbya sp. AN02str TaxID=3423363 RepID=UPI003D31D6E3
MLQFHRLWRGWRGVVLGAIATSLAVVLLLQMAPRSSALPSLPTPAVQPGATSRPVGVERVGNLEVMLVEFEGSNLFRVTQSAPQANVPANEQFLVEDRVQEIQDNLRAVIAIAPPTQVESANYSTRFDPETFVVVVARLNNDTVLIARDGSESQSQFLLTVTGTDAQYYGTTIEELAERWRDTLQQTVQAALRERQPAALLEQAQSAVFIGFGMLVLTAIMLYIRRILNYRFRLLQERRAQVQADARAGATADTRITTGFGPLPAVNRFPFWGVFQLHPNLERRLNINSFLRWLNFWGLAFIWLGGIRWILSLFPGTRAFSNAVWLTPISILIIWFLAGLLNRIGDLLISHFAKAWEENEFFPFEGDIIQRRLLRISTIVRVLKGLKTFTIFAIAGGWALSLLGVPTGSVLTFGAVLAFAISLASQNLIKDLVNGFLILVEDQYGIGDIIQVDQVSGLVENMNLRITQLRNAEGRLITIPNSLINQVQNLTRVWSRVDLPITVAYDADIRKVFHVLHTIADEFYHDSEWQPKLIKEPEVLGIDDVSHAGILIRLWIETQPLQQYLVGREFRKRMLFAFEEHGIEIGMPQQMLRTGHDMSPQMMAGALGMSNGESDRPSPNQKAQQGAIADSNSDS